MTPADIARDPLVQAARWAYEHARPDVAAQALRNLREARLRARQRALHLHLRVTGQVRQ